MSTADMTVPLRCRALQQAKMMLDYGRGKGVPVPNLAAMV
jgi:hypothetical protein